MVCRLQNILKISANQPISTGDFNRNQNTIKPCIWQSSMIMTYHSPIFKIHYLNLNFRSVPKKGTTAGIRCLIMVLKFSTGIFPTNFTCISTYICWHIVTCLMHPKAPVKYQQYLQGLSINLFPLIVSDISTNITRLLSTFYNYFQYFTIIFVLMFIFRFYYITLSFFIFSNTKSKRI